VKPANAALIAFLLATVIGFLAIASGFLAWADYTNFSDREGSTGMAWIFVFAPIGGVAIGILSAFATFRILKKRRAV
jgi:TRAP-type C4-dicarboxylate transport system permease small subunit